ncbi:MAG: hypothetical protein LBD01_01275, partial [Puniceicoccales bacterium]|nr:hypothetical protein [Puniceicoccales bacterium]
MSTKSLFYTLSIAASILFSFVPSTQGAGMSISAPSVAVKRDSPYYEEIKNLQTLLQKQKMEELYPGMWKLAEMLWEDRTKRKEEMDYLVAKEWLRYSQVRAPLNIDVKRFRLGFTMNDYLSIKRRVNIKRAVIESLDGENTKEKAERLKIDHGEFLTMRAIYFRECIFALARAHTTVLEGLSNLEKECFEPMDAPKDDEEEIAQMERAVAFGTPMWSARHLGIETSTERYETDFVKKLILGFPKDIPHIQFCVRQIGYRTDYECARFLEKAVGRGKETEYLFRGLPSKKVTDEIFLNSEKDRMRRTMHYEMGKLKP